MHHGCVIRAQAGIQWQVMCCFAWVPKCAQMARLGSGAQSRAAGFSAAKGERMMILAAGRQVAICAGAAIADEPRDHDDTGLRARLHGYRRAARPDRRRSTD